MTGSSNIFSDPPSLTSDEALEKLRHQLTPKEIAYCTKHFLSLINDRRYENLSVGSVQRYYINQKCSVCAVPATVIVVE